MITHKMQGVNAVEALRVKFNMVAVDREFWAVIVSEAATASVWCCECVCSLRSCFLCLEMTQY